MRTVDIIYTASTERDKRMAIIKQVAVEHGVTVRDILGPRRHAHIVRARWKAIRAVYETFDDSLPHIGRTFNRDHTSVMHALRKTAPPPHSQAWLARIAGNGCEAPAFGA
jgi:chromosomal replication initiation ATPase DnaA